MKKRQLILLIVLAIMILGVSLFFLFRKPILNMVQQKENNVEVNENNPQEDVEIIDEQQEEEEIPIDVIEEEPIEDNVKEDMEKHDKYNFNEEKEFEGLGTEILENAYFSVAGYGSPQLANSKATDYARKSSIGYAISRIDYKGLDVYYVHFNGKDDSENTKVYGLENIDDGYEEVIFHHKEYNDFKLYVKDGDYYYFEEGKQRSGVETLDEFTKILEEGGYYHNE